MQEVVLRMMIAIVNDLRFFILHFISFLKLKSGIKTGRKMICCIRIQIISL
jgi:hypothetical protein